MHQAFDHRVTVLVGNYGSGKTEIALNLVMAMAQTGPTTLVDLDIVNPYFRSAERQRELDEMGIALIAPLYANTTVDVPALSPKVISAFTNRGQRVVFDVGGDDTGAVALGQYKQYFERDDYALLFVINTLRPFSNSADAIIDLMGRVSNRARLPIEGLIHNTNLAALSDAKMVSEGQAIVDEVCKLTELPLVAIVGTHEVLGNLPKNAGLHFPITPMMRPEWF